MIKIVAVAIVCAILILYLKTVKSELALPATVGAGLIIIYLSINYLSETFNFFSELINMTGIEGGLYTVIFKITAIGYLVEFGAGIVEDFGLKSLSDKLVFAGKIIILGVSMPVLYAVFNLLKGLTSG